MRDEESVKDIAVGNVERIQLRVVGGDTVRPLSGVGTPERDAIVKLVERNHAMRLRKVRLVFAMCLR